MSSSTIVDLSTGLQKDQAQFGKGQRLYTGPDGVGDHQVTVLDPTFVGEGAASPDATANTEYLFRAPKEQSPPTRRSRSAMVGSIGWGVPQQQDVKLLKSDHQIKTGHRGPFRQANEDRYTHRLQAPWYPTAGHAKQTGQNQPAYSATQASGPRFPVPLLPISSSATLNSARSEAESVASFRTTASNPTEDS